MKRGVLGAVASTVVAPALIGAVGPSAAKASHDVVGDGVVGTNADPLLASFAYVAALNQSYDRTGHK